MLRVFRPPHARLYRFAQRSKWTKQSLSWRLANDPDLQVRVRPLKGAATRGFDNDKC